MRAEPAMTGTEGVKLMVRFEETPVVSLDETYEQLLRGEAT